MLQWSEEDNLLMADWFDDVQSIAHPSGPRQVGMMDENDLVVYLVHPDGTVEMTHHPDHWGLPAWYAEEEVRDEP